MRCQQTSTQNSGAINRKIQRIVHRTLCHVVTCCVEAYSNERLCLEGLTWLRPKLEQSDYDFYQDRLIQRSVRLPDRNTLTSLAKAVR